MSVFANPTDSTGIDDHVDAVFDPHDQLRRHGEVQRAAARHLDPIPSDYDCSFCWWKIKYDLGSTPSGSPADTTTWSAAIKGDPVHLVNE